jgi:hypothetical protein
MSIVFAALISFLGLSLLVTHLGHRGVRRIVGYAGWVDLTLHVSVIWLFMGTSTLGLLQAEACAIMVTLSLRLYRYLLGYERLSTRGWVRYAGRWT